MNSAAGSWGLKGQCNHKKVKLDGSYIIYVVWMYFYVYNIVLYSCKEGGNVCDYSKVAVVL